MMRTSWVFTAIGLTGLMISSVAELFTPTPSQPNDSSNVFNDTTTQEASANITTVFSLATSTPYVIPTTTVAREQGTAHEDENSRLWLGVGLGAGGMAGVVLVLVLVMVVVLRARRWHLPCGQEGTASPPAASLPAAAASPPAASLPAAAAFPADCHNYEGLQSRPERAPPGQVYEAISESTGNADVYENPDTVLTLTAHATGGSKQSKKRDPKGNGGQEKKVEGGEMYVNYTPSRPPRPPRHENLKHVQSVPSPPPVPLSPPPRRPNPSVCTNADEGDPSNDDYVDMNGPAAASMTRKTKI